MVTIKIYFIYRLDIRVNRLDCSQLTAMKNSGTLLPWRVAEEKKMEIEMTAKGVVDAYRRYKEFDEPGLDIGFIEEQWGVVS